MIILILVFTLELHPTRILFLDFIYGDRIVWSTPFFPLITVSVVSVVRYDTSSFCKPFLRANIIELSTRYTNDYSRGSLRQPFLVWQSHITDDDRPVISVTCFYLLSFILLMYLNLRISSDDEDLGFIFLYSNPFETLWFQTIQWRNPVSSVISTPEGWVRIVLVPPTVIHPTENPLRTLFSVFLLLLDTVLS